MSNPYGSTPQPYGQGGGPQPIGQPATPYGQQPAWGAPAAPPEPTSTALPVVTTETVPGRQVAGVVGPVVGVVARARELRPDLRHLHPFEGYSAMLADSRTEAISKLVAQAQRAGAHAVVGLRFDSSEITQSLSEVVAYGTAVTLAD